jgi:hypothetical protein
MALYILQPGLQSLGDFDLLDTDLSLVTGGELAVLDKTSRLNTSSEKAAADVFDGYVADGANVGTRVVARLADGYSDSFLDASKGDIKVEPWKTFYLIDDGTAKYGTMLGGLIGSPVGLGTAVSANLGPHTAAASGKVTLWDKPGLYAVSLDAVSAGLGDLNDTPLPGDLIYREHNTGKLTSLSDTEDKVAMFVEMTSNRSLVNTPGRLVGATSNPDRLVIQYFGAGFGANL